ncbi:MAG TPA: glycosyltransferase family 2 protein [Cyclobacteriaceae bacterium]
MDLSNTAVVILNYNGKPWLEKFLPGVVHHSGNARIIVADNHSTDDSIQFLKANFSSIDIIVIPSNLGFCGGYNFALNLVKEKYYILLNSDVEVTSGWIEPVIQLLESNPLIAAAQPKILSYSNKDFFEYAGAAGGYIDTLGYPFCRGRIFNETEKDQGQYDDTRQVFWATGACLFIRSECYHQMNGLDEDFFAHMEEIDLCWRLQKAGYEIHYQGQSNVYHVGGGTLAVSNPRKTYFNFRNGLSLIFKNLSFFELIWKFPLRIFLDWIASFKFLLDGSAKDCKAVWTAHFDFIKSIGGEISKRKSTAKKSKYNDTLPMVYGKLLIVDYFLFKKKSFNDLEF